MEKDNRPHVLLAEDETSLGFLLKENLRLAGFTIKVCKDGMEALEAFSVERFDICIFDVNMPKKDGFELAKDVRKKDQYIPIIFLTANSTEEDKLKGFEIGADEYITKPFSTQELIARMKAILKRSQSNQKPLTAIDDKINVGHLSIDFQNHIILHNGKEIRISATEAELLKIFIINKNNPLTRSAILLYIWGRDDFYTARNLDVYINKLRKMLKIDPSLEIVNIHGTGFKLAENVEA